MKSGVKVIFGRTVCTTFGVVKGAQLFHASSPFQREEGLVDGTFAHLGGGRSVRLGGGLGPGEGVRLRGFCLCLDAGGSSVTFSSFLATWPLDTLANTVWDWSTSSRSFSTPSRQHGYTIIIASRICLINLLISTCNNYCVPVLVRSRVLFSPTNVCSRITNNNIN